MILKFRVYEQTISLQATKSEPRQGSRDYLELQFSFSPDWNDLLKYAYIQHGEVSVPHDLVEGSVIVDEYFTEQTEFNVTLFGKSADGSIEVPTNVITVFLKESNNLWVKDAPEPQNSWFVQVADARDEALAAAVRAENAAIHQPYPNEETGTWWVWSAETGKYEDTGESYGVGGGTSVQSDWSVNDETDPAYVKGRTHYSEVSVEEILPLQEIKNTGAEQYSIPYIPEDVHDQTSVTVLYNGVEYDMYAGYSQGLGMYLITGLDVPCEINTYDGASYLVPFVQPTVDTITISVYRKNETVHPLDPKFGGMPTLAEDGSDAGKVVRVNSAGTDFELVAMTNVAEEGA